MRWRYWIFPSAIVALAAIAHFTLRSLPVAAAPSMPQASAFLLAFGLGDRSSTVWDGTITVTGGEIATIRGWRFAKLDSTDGHGAWRLSTRPAAGQGGNPGPMAENGVVVTAMLPDQNARFSVHTAQGDFSFTGQEIGYGAQKRFLDGRALVDRVPLTVQLTTSVEEQDHPAMTRNGDDVWVVYVEFVHGDRSAPRGPFRTEPESLDFLARPPGGNQVFLLHYSRQSRVWSAPMAVSRPGQDVMRAAVAADAQGRVWVFWSAARDGNFDIFARTYAQNRWSAERRLTSDPGPDLDPVAATDSQGRVWLTWQGHRNGNLEVLAAAQDGDAFTGETTVSFSPASDWDPAIAAAPNGDIAISWDTYDKGDYDVWFRRLHWNGGIAMDSPVAAAASDNFEARSSLTFDGQNRLWVAFEASAMKWGKDFGAYETTGVALYQGHNLRVLCFQGDERYTTAANLKDVLPGAPTAQLFPRKLGGAANAVLPNPNLAPNRKPNGGPGAPALPLNSFPRIAADPDGTVYLAFRSTAGNARAGVGSIWMENVVWFDGARWSTPILAPGSDGLLDSRPALLATGPGELLMVAAGDHRQSAVKAPGGDPVNTDLYAAELRLDRVQRPLQLTALPPEVPAAPDPEGQAERDMIAALRRNRAVVAGTEYRLLRGEFHRHTEISGDGARDGPVIDAYRYLIDAASMDWGGCCDHDNGGGREYYWWIEQQLTDAYHLGADFIPMFSYERSVSYPEGHRNMVFPRRGVRPLPRLPKTAADSAPEPAPDTAMLYRYLKLFEGICASHTSGTDMGTDWRDNDPLLEPVVEIYQGDRQNYEMPAAPRANSERDSIGGWRPAGFVSLALAKGYRLGFQASSDHISTHMSYCNLWVTEPTREGIMEAFRQRRVYGATDNIYADVRCGDHFMGEEFTVTSPPVISVNLWGIRPFARVHVIKDNEYVYTAEPNDINAAFEWRDDAAQRGRTSYYYVRGEQVDGELVWVSPMWIRYQ